MPSVLITQRSQVQILPPLPVVASQGPDRRDGGQAFLIIRWRPVGGTGPLSPARGARDRQETALWCCTRGAVGRLTVGHWAGDVPRSRHDSFVTTDGMGQRGGDVGFAERLLEVIDSGRRVATYKLAVLLALLDLCARHGDAAGQTPALLYTRDIAEQVAALYWPQVIPYRLAGTGTAVELRQITLPRAAVVQAVSVFRGAAAAAGTTSWQLARQRRRCPVPLDLSRWQAADLWWLSWGGGTLGQVRKSRSPHS